MCPFPRSPRLQTFDHSACNCGSLVGPCCVLRYAGTCIGFVHPISGFRAAQFWNLSERILKSVTHCERQLIQGDSVGEVSVLVGDSMGHCEKNVLTSTCLILSSYRERAV